MTGNQRIHLYLSGSTLLHLFIKLASDLLNDFRMRRTPIRRLLQIAFKIIELAALQVKFPLAHADGQSAMSGLIDDDSVQG